MPPLSAAEIKADARYRLASALLNEIWRENLIAFERRRDFLFFATDRIRKLRAQRPEWMNDIEDKQNAED